MDKIISLLTEYRNNCSMLTLHTAQRLLYEVVKREEHKAKYRQDWVTDYEQVKDKPTKKTGQTMMRYGIKALAPRSKEVMDALYSGFTFEELINYFGVNKFYMAMYLKACGWTWKGHETMRKWQHSDGTEIHATGAVFASQKEVKPLDGIIHQLGYLESHRRWITSAVERQWSPKKINETYRNIDTESLQAFVLREMGKSWNTRTKKWDINPYN